METTCRIRTCELKKGDRIIYNNHEFKISKIVNNRVIGMNEDTFNSTDLFSAGSRQWVDIIIDKPDINKKPGS